jgi:hypothetical protein
VFKQLCSEVGYEKSNTGIGHRVDGAGVQAAFIVEPLSPGLASDHFTGTPRVSTTGWSTAVGCTLVGVKSAYGSTVGTTGPQHIYVYSYTPGVDVDNTVLTAGTDLGNGDLATGLVGGSGLYNVYATWAGGTTNVDKSGCNYAVSNDGANIVVGPLNQNVGGAAGGNKWLLIASNVSLTAGVKYTVTQTANSTAWTSMRSSGVMWEMTQAIPEPMSLLLLGAGALAVRKFRKA